MGTRLNPFALEFKPVAKRRVYLVHDESGQEIDIMVREVDNTSMFSSQSLLMDVIRRYVPKKERTGQFAELPERSEYIRLTGGRVLDVSQAELELVCAIYPCQCADGEHVFSVEELVVINRAWPEAISHILEATAGVATDDGSGNAALVPGNTPSDAALPKGHKDTHILLSGPTNCLQVSTTGSDSFAMAKPVVTSVKSKSTGSKTRVGCTKTKFAK